MQAIMEGAFDLIYLCAAFGIGLYILINCLGSTSKKITKNQKNQYLVFAVASVILAMGDFFHLYPRVYALFTVGIDEYFWYIGMGKFITSITITVFYVFLYEFWKLRFKENTKFDLFVYGLAALRLLLCFFPQNEWTMTNSPLSWGIIRNVPFVIMGGLMVYLFYDRTKKNADEAFKYMWLAIVLSFVFYIPVVLFGDVLPVIGILMLPKTVAYVWMLYMGFLEFRKLKIQQFQK